MTDLIAAAKAVVERWETPAWKDAPATAGYIYALRDAVQAAAIPEPVAYGFAPHGDGRITDALVIGRNDDPEYNIPLYAHPPPADERIALLEGLLRECLPMVISRSIMSAIEYKDMPAPMQRTADKNTALLERIRAALEGK